MTQSTQQLFFQLIKGRLPVHLSLAEEIGELLNISIDSAYRRIRGEKAIDFEELAKLAVAYKVSLDQFLHLSSDGVLFSDRSLEPISHSNFSLYLKALISDLTYMNGFEEKKLFYLNKDVPVFYHFTYPELAAFKCFFWMRSIVHDPALAKEKFLLEKYMHLFEEESKKINKLYAAIPSTEIWNIESINSTIRQIEYYKDTKVFVKPEDIKLIYESLLRTIDRIEQSAENGYKAAEEKGTLAQGGAYEIYINEFILGDNTILAHLNGSTVVYINHAVHHYMYTDDQRFCQFTDAHFQNIIRRSVPISRVNEKERTKFFNRNREKIYNRLENIRL